MTQPAPRKGPARQAIETFLAGQQSPVTTARIRHATGLESEMVTNTLNSMRRAGQLLISGCKPMTLYQLVEPQAVERKPPKKTVWTAEGKPKWEPPTPKPEAEIVYPEGYQHSVSATPAIHRIAYQGESWPNSTLRPGCQDHLQHPSRRGDVLVEHRPPISMQSSSPRGTESRVLTELQRIAGGR